MPLISSSIPNLINGVSQQPPALRLASQAEEVINCMPSPVEGLKKRPPLYHIKNPSGTTILGFENAATYAQTGITIAVTTSSAHGLSTGDTFPIYFSTGDAVSGTFTITVLTSTTFSVTADKSISGTSGNCTFTTRPDKRPFVHLVERDGDVRYIIIIRDNDIKVCDLDGTTYTPTTPDGTGYLNIDGKPSETFRVASVADYTFIVNREKEVAMATTTSPAHMQGGSATQSMVFIKAANYDTEYKVNLNGTEKTFTTDPAGGLVLEGVATFTPGSASVSVESLGVAGAGHGLSSSGGEKFKIRFNGTIPSNRPVNAGSFTHATTADETSLTYTNTESWPTTGAGGSVTSINCTVTIERPLSTITIANKLAAKLDKDTAGGVAGFSVRNDDHLIEIIKDDGGDYTLSSTDAKGGEDTKAIKDVVDDLDDLPVIGYQGFIVKVQGSKATELDDYYVKFELSKEGQNVGTFGEGVWRETVAPGIKFEFDGTTMPHILTRTVDTSTNPHTVSFSFKKYSYTDNTVTPAVTKSWSGRIAGDKKTAPEPSFVGSTIQNINLFRNRLIFVADENVILSAADSYDRFWPETVQTIIDSDPVDLSTGGTSINLLKSTIAFANTLLLFSRHSQFRLDAGLNVGSSLTPKTATITKITSYDMVESVDPIAVGRNTYFATPKGNFSGLREFFLPDSSGSVPLSEDVTSSIPRFIDDNLCTLVSAVAEEALIMISADQPKRIYIYKFFFEEDTKLQSAWSYWELKGDNKKIIGGVVQGSDLYVLVQHIDGIHLEKVSLRPEQIDAGAEIEILLDRKTTESETGVSFSLNNAGALGVETVITLPYPVDINDDIVVVGRHDPDAYADEQSFPSTMPANNTVIAIEDATGIEVNSSGVATNARTLGSTSDNITINAFPESLRGAGTNKKTLPAGVKLAVTATSTANTYTFLKLITLRHGQVIEPISQTNRTITVLGDLTNTKFFIGNRYEMTYEFSTPYIKEQPSGGGVALAAGPKLQMRTWTVIFDESSAFELKVTPASRDTNTYPYNGVIVGEAPPLIGDPSVLTGSFRVPVMASNIDTKIVISSTSPLPCRFQSAEWEGFYHTRAKRT